MTNYVRATCPHCNATYQYRLPSAMSVICQNCGELFTLRFDPSDIIGFGSGSHDQIGWPQVCMGCGTQEGLTALDESLNRKAVISSTTLGYQTRSQIRTFSGTARLSLCPSCSKLASSVVQGRRLPGTFALMVSLAVLLILWLPYGGVTWQYGVIAGLWVPLIFLFLGPLRPVSRLDVFGKIGIQRGSGTIGMSFLNPTYLRAFAGANPSLETWVWGNMPEDYVDTSPKVNVELVLRVMSIMACPAFLFGLVLFSTAGLGVVVSMGSALVAGGVFYLVFSAVVNQRLQVDSQAP